MKDDGNMANGRSEIGPVLRREPGAFEQFVRDYQRLVSHIVFRLVPNEADRQDLCQDVFLTLYEKLDTFRGDCKLSSWIGRIAHNKCLHYLEKKKVPLYDDVVEDERTIDSVGDDSEGPDDRAVRLDLGARVRAEIDRLPLIYGTMLALYHLEGMSYREIGEITSLPDGTVKSYLFRGRRLLKKRLAEQFQPEELWR